MTLASSFGLRVALACKSHVSVITIVFPRLCVGHGVCETSLSDEILRVVSVFQYCRGFQCRKVCT